MDELFDFASLCPKCGQAKHQDGYTHAELRTLLEAGEPIEAYCVACDEAWPIARDQRVEIARRLAAEEQTTPLQPGAPRPSKVLR